MTHPLASSDQPLDTANETDPRPIDSPIGFGTWPFVGDEAQAAVESALEVGYRFIDTAAKYENEDGVGRGIAASGLARDEIYLQTKLRGSEHGDPRAALEASLERLGVDYVDSYLIHWPLPMIGKYIAAFETMAELQQEGLVREIGVSNFLPEHLDALEQATGLVPAIDQIQCDPTIARDEMRADIRARGVRVQAWRPMGKGTVLELPEIAAIAAARGKTAGQIVLAWHSTIGNVPIARSANPERQRQNLEAVTDIVLTGDELAAIAGLPQHEEERFDPRTHEEF
ncbi:aldo/keto reductase [Gulosibacter macacae]|uniref:Aldo/keto reductase n=1 Tax=Gulosibacter macacae TaxID=2488791 RepID=A0A3P3VTR5_9MICO|nr:aldo/keto reductase [Gulosibacter macacae]RRJ86201.1 aldo/keto reductase [Gulosibacter macacae]